MDITLFVLVAQRLIVQATSGTNFHLYISTHDLLLGNQVLGGNDVDYALLSVFMSIIVATGLDIHNAHKDEDNAHKYQQLMEEIRIAKEKLSSTPKVGISCACTYKQNRHCNCKQNRNCNYR